MPEVSAAAGFAHTLRLPSESRIIPLQPGPRFPMEFNQVRYFLTLAETLNFTRAAEACNVTQPALTRAIQKLEEELGGLLFYRERGLTQLTELGQLMRPLLEQASAAAQSAREQALAFKRRETSPLRLGLDYSIAASTLTPVLGELAARIKGFELVMRQYSSVEICRLALEGAIDAGLVVGLDKIPERLNRWTLYDEGLVVLCPPTHRFARSPEVTVSDLAQERILRREIPSCAIAATLEPVFAAAGVTPQIQHSGSQEDHLHEMVKASLGIAIAAERQPVPAGLIARRFTTVPARAVALAAIAGRQHGPSVANFLKLMRARDWSDQPDAPAPAAARNPAADRGPATHEGRPA
jgi:DNA-binding transcriptional LysR family regulator